LNRGMLKSNIDKSPYKLWKGRPKNVNNFRVFRRKFYIKREDGKIGKFESWVYKGIFVQYSRKSKEYKCFNLRLNRIVESINVHINDDSVWNSKEESKDFVEQEEEEDLKEEVEEEEAEEEEEQPYIGVDWEGSVDDIISTRGDSFYLGDCMVSWLRKKQYSISFYMVEVEYIAATTCFTWVL
jgi:hypothetical protein